MTDRSALKAPAAEAAGEPPRYNVTGVGVSALTLPRATELILGAKGRLRRGYVCLATAHGLTEARRDPELRRIYNESWLTTPDGMPLVWLGPPGTGRVYGPDLMLAVCAAGRASGLRHFFCGGTPGVAEELREKLIARFPGLEVTGTYCPPFRPFTPEERLALKAEVKRTQPDVLWVGVSSPKQERFMAEYLPRLEATVMLGVGAAFDILAGNVAQAPRWMQRSGLEWLYRLSREPRRLGPRYLVNNPLFGLRIAGQLSGLRRYEIER